MSLSADLERLVKDVAYMFYTGEETMVLLGFLDLGRPITAEELSKHLKYSKNQNELPRVLGLLRNDGLISVDSREDLTDVENPKELTAAQRKKLMKDYWYLDYKSFIDSVNIKIHLVKRKLAELCGPEQQIYYECPKCKAEDGGRNQSYKKYIWELGSLLAGFSGDDDTELRCLNCKTPVCELDEKEDINEKKRTAKEFDELVEPLIQIIDSTRDWVVINDPDKRCKDDEIMRRTDYDTHKERVRCEKERMRLIGGSKSSGSMSSGSVRNGKVDINVNLGGEEAVRHQVQTDGFIKKLDMKVVEEPVEKKEVPTIEIKGRTYTAEELTDDVVNSLNLDDDEFERVMTFRDN